MTVPTISITGGIGNQLFQWSAAHVLFQPFKFNLDLHHYQINAERDFELSPLVEQCSHWNHSSRVPKTFPIMKMLESSAYRGVPEKMLEFFGYFEEINHPLDLPDRIKSRMRRRLPIFLSGLFQNASVVEEAYPLIEAELMEVIERSFASMKSRFQIPKQYMAIHVRRGDYPISTATSNAIGQLDDSFFIELAAENNLPILLLTENAYEVQELSKILKPALVITNVDADPLHSLSIFANSNFFIGSNSSLSWWGAYLVHKQNKSSWLPREWSQWGTHENSYLKLDTIGFSPSKWKIKCEQLAD